MFSWSDKPVENVGCSVRLFVAGLALLQASLGAPRHSPITKKISISTIKKRLRVTFFPFVATSTVVRSRADLHRPFPNPPHIKGQRLIQSTNVSFGTEAPPAMVLPPPPTPHTGTRHYRRLRVSAHSGRHVAPAPGHSRRPRSPSPWHMHQHARRPATRPGRLFPSRCQSLFLNETPIPPHPVALAQPFLTCSAVCRYHQRNWTRLVAPLACPASPSSWWSR